MPTIREDFASAISRIKPKVGVEVSTSPADISSRTDKTWFVNLTLHPSEPKGIVQSDVRAFKDLDESKLYVLSWKAEPVAFPEGGYYAVCSGAFLIRGKSEFAFGKDYEVLGQFDGIKSRGELYLLFERNVTPYTFKSDGRKVSAEWKSEYLYYGDELERYLKSHPRGFARRVRGYGPSK